MKIEEWLAAGLEPPIGTVDQWISDQLGRAGAEEEASYAVAETRREGEGVRILVATDLGLYDAFWSRPPEPDEHSLTGAFHRWQEVQGLRLTARTERDASLRRREPDWSLTVEQPAIEIGEAVDQDALLAFWKACRTAMDRGA